MSIVRFNPDYSDRSMRIVEDGKWVLHEEHEAAMESQKKETEEMRQAAIRTLERLRKEHRDDEDEWSHRHYDLLNRITEESFVEVIWQWKHSWMDVKGTDERDRKNYSERAFGVDANMQYDLARRLLRHFGKEVRK